MLDFLRHWRRSLGSGVVILLAATWLSVLAGVCQTALADTAHCPHCPELAVAECDDMAAGPCMDTQSVAPQATVVPARLLSDADETPPVGGVSVAAPRRVIALSDVVLHDPPPASIPLYLRCCRFIE